MMNWIGQEEPNGCGVACLAMLTGKTYRQVRDEIGRSFHNDGCPDSLLDAYLAANGYAVQRIFAGEQPYHPQPWAKAHLCVVYACMPHLVVMDEDGNVFDPHDHDQQRLRLDDYSDVVSVAGVWPVAMPNERR
jgi:hypothetical protein